MDIEKFINFVKTVSLEELTKEQAEEILQQIENSGALPIMMEYSDQSISKECAAATYYCSCQIANREGISSFAEVAERLQKQVQLEINLHL